MHALQRFFCWSLLFTTLLGHSQNYSSSDILQSLQRLNTVGSVLYIAAHPDDENTRLIAWLVRAKNVRTGYLSVTRGDGGQNLIGGEQGEALGVIRTNELLAARKIDGGEQFFTRANDFGFSKNPDETFRIWQKDSVLSDMVLIIRQFRPDLIICRFPTTGEGGHGHHTASAILAVQAFRDAADPSKFTWQLSMYPVWQAKQLYWNTFNFGGTNTTSPDQIKEDAGTYNVLSGRNYGEIASESRSMHRSQGFGTLLQRGPNVEYFKWLDGEPAGQSLFSRVDITWNRFPGGKKISQLIEKALHQFDPAQPSSLVPSLINIHRELAAFNSSSADASYWKELKLKECTELMERCTGLFCEAITSEGIATPGSQITVSFQVINRSSAPLHLKKISMMGADTTLDLLLQPNVPFTYRALVRIPEQTPVTTPYWLREPHSTGMYKVADVSYIGKPINPAAFEATAVLDFEKTPIELRRPVRYKYADPSRGEKYKALEILPRVTVQIPDKVVVLNGNGERHVHLMVHSNVQGFEGDVTVIATGGFNVSLKDARLKLNKNEEKALDLVISPPKDAQSGTLTVLVDGVPAMQIKKLTYDHIPEQSIAMPCEAMLVKTDMQTSGGKIAYIPGAGDDVAASLRQVGYNVTELSNEELEKEDLSVYSAIITGVRAYNTNEKLQSLNEKLLSYVNNGGNLIVQYNTNSRVGPLNARIGPYPFNITRDRVTDENATVNFLLPTHPVLNQPNKITEKDFDGWIQERGIYFAGDIDSHYQTVISMNDPGEKPAHGSLIVAPFGKGNFVYTGLAFFRELPAGVPGAFRLFANLIALQPHQ